MTIGKENDFAIEITDYDRGKRAGRIRLHLGGKIFGDGKKLKSVEPLISTLQKIIETGDSLYDESFNDSKLEDIFSAVLVLHAETGNWTDDDYRQLDRYERFTSFWGEQFSNVTAVFFNKKRICHVLWSMNKCRSGERIDYLKNLNESQISLSTVAAVKDEFMQCLGL